MTSNGTSWLKLGGGALLLGVAGFLLVTSPWTWSAIHGSQDLPALDGADLANGRTVFVASDCATCHETPGLEDDTHLGGGRSLETAFGTFHMPNISPDEATGIGRWTLAEFDRALREGVGPDGALPDGQNLYPAFPYTSYRKLTGTDVRDLYAYMMSLPAVSNEVPAHELNFPYNLRRGVGVWRLAFLGGDGYTPGPVPEGVDADLYHRGEYLVEGPGHCAECHSPRGPMGDVVASKRYGGGPNPEGTGWFPNISPDQTGIGYWSAARIANYLHTGVNPVGRTADGDMAEVVRNTSQLPFEDVQAMAVYLKTLPPIDNRAPGLPEPNYSNHVVMLDQAIGVAPQLPVSSPSAIVKGTAATVVETKDVWLGADMVGTENEPEGKLLGGAAVEVAGRNGDKVELVLKGWQLEEASSILYQARGQRVMMAVLDDAAAATVTRGAPETDPETGQSWVPAEITLWSDANGLNTDRAAVWAYGQDTFQKACAACHVLPQQTHFTANQWIGTLKAMRRFTSFTDDQYRLILAYLQNHSKDLNTSAGVVE
ncbi:c-type cytochrome [Rhodovulum kholense]|uniref:Mono/diheme cytochrome c family protein n=1 Tax=Rhodovulum kholense TaxID=453584 RepID=A0A8E3AR39_9RHOB|nr:c-type cytochrome [Rhodovulum kholense]PTW50453.1 mono/diheme cytochrome c family protein [Rhodovulum kholense]